MTIRRVGLFACGFLALIAGINAAPPRWKPLTVSPGPGGGGNGYSYNLFRGGATTVYDPTSNELILFAGFSDDPSPDAPRFNDLWVLNNANGLPKGSTAIWSILIPNGDPNSPHVRYNHSAVYDVANNRMIIYGGCGSTVASQGCEPIANNVWVLSNANGVGGTPTWTLLSPTGTPPRPRQGHQAVYDPNTNSMIVWGGQDGGGSFCDTFSEVWVLHNANGLGGIPNWTQLLFTGGPPAGQYFSTAVYDSSNNILIVFGGFGLVGGNCSALTNAVWALSHANGIGGTQVWTNLTAQDAAGSPANRAQQAAVYSPSTNRMTISGGSDSNGGLNDTWVLSNANGLGVTPPVWKQLQFTGNIPGPSSRWNAGVIDTVNNLTIMSFGTGNSDGPQWGTWILTNPSGSSTTAR